MRRTSVAWRALVVSALGVAAASRASATSTAGNVSYDVTEGTLYQGYGLFSNSSPDALLNPSRITVTQQPTHGTLTIVPNYLFDGSVRDVGWFVYAPGYVNPADPSQGFYVGNDTAKFCYGPTVGGCISSTGTITFHVKTGVPPPDVRAPGAPVLLLPLDEPLGSVAIRIRQRPDGAFTALIGRAHHGVDLATFRDGGVSASRKTLDSSPTAVPVSVLPGSPSWAGDMLVAWQDTAKKQVNLARIHGLAVVGKVTTLNGVSESAVTALTNFGGGAYLLTTIASGGKALRGQTVDANLKVVRTIPLVDISTDPEHTLVDPVLEDGLATGSPGGVPYAVGLATLDPLHPPPQNQTEVGLVDLLAAVSSQPVAVAPPNVNVNALPTTIVRLGNGDLVVLMRWTWAGGRDPYRMATAHFSLSSEQKAYRLQQKIYIEDANPELERAQDVVRGGGIAAGPAVVITVMTQGADGRSYVLLRTVSAKGELGTKVFEREQVDPENYELVDILVSILTQGGLKPTRLVMRILPPGPQKAALPAGIYALDLTFPQPCVPSDTTICLNNGRFEVDVNDTDHSNAFRVGHGVKLTDDTGYYWFFDPKNVEMVLKVIDGCGLGGRYWIYSGGLTDVLTTVTVTDTTTGQMVTFTNPQGVPFQPYQNTAAFACSLTAAAETSVAPVSPPRAHQDLASILAELTIGKASVPCHADDTHLCLQNGRFEVSTAWETGDGKSGAGHAVPIKPAGVNQPDTGYFWFFSSSNVEEVLKVLPGCALNQRYWVFAGGLTNVKVTTTIRDAQSGVVRAYVNNQGQAFAPVQDTSAFATCP